MPVSLDIIRFLEKRRYKCLGIGLYRTAFAINTREVIKIPHGLDTEFHNRAEAEIYKHHGKFGGAFPKAACQPINVFGYPCLRMERVKPVTPQLYATMRRLREYEWIMSIDSGQVGFDKCGFLVAFDYGNFRL